MSTVQVIEKAHVLVYEWLSLRYVLQLLEVSSGPKARRKALKSPSSIWKNYIPARLNTSFNSQVYRVASSVAR